jgi:hypothetical protein
VHAQSSVAIPIARNRVVGGIIIFSGVFILAVSLYVTRRPQFFLGSTLMIFGLLHVRFPVILVTESEIRLVNIFGFATRRLSYDVDAVRVEHNKLFVGHEVIRLSKIAVRSADVRTVMEYFQAAKNVPRESAGS